MTSKIECQVCCDLSRHVFSCTSCEHRVCRTCCRRIAADFQPECPQCHLPWTTEECRRRLGITYYKTVHRRQIRKRLLKREMARLPHAAPYARRERQRRFLKGEIRRLHFEIRDHARWELLPDLRVAQATLRIVVANSPLSEGNAVRPLMPCPHDGCDGVVTDTQQCNLCQRSVCERCGQPRHDGRPCDPAILNNMTHIRETTRPCVNCGVPSFRSEGCPVMWCSQCHVFWHWDRRRIIETRSGVVPHNPDHRAFVATRQGRARELGDLPCGGFPDSTQIHHSLRTYVSHSSHPQNIRTQVPAILLAIEAIHHTQLIVRPRYPRMTAQNDATLLRLRIEYLLGDFATENEYAERIETHERLAEMKRDIGEVLETFVFSGLDVLQRFVTLEDAALDDVSLASTLVEFDQLHTIVNESLSRISQTWSRKTPTLTPDWKWILPYRRRVV